MPRSAPPKSKGDPTEPTRLSVLRPRPSGKRSGSSANQTEMSPRDEDRPAVARQTRLRLKSEDPFERAVALSELALSGGRDSFAQITKAFDDPTLEVRNAAARALCALRSDRAGWIYKAFHAATAERRRRIASSVAASDLVGDVVEHLSSEDLNIAYEAFSLLFLIAKAGEVKSMLQAVEEHPSIETRQTLVQLLAQCEQPGILPAFSRLAVRQSLPSEVRSALMQAIHQIRSEPIKVRAPAVLPPVKAKNK